MKKRLMIFILCIAMVCSLAACASGDTTQQATTKTTKNDKALLVVSFGTSYNDTRAKTIDATEEYLGNAFSEYDLKRAFTSQIIIDKLKDRDGLEIDNVEQAFEKLVDEGYKNVVVQPLHVINGEEYDDLSETAAAYAKSFDSLVLGKPLLTSVEDYQTMADAIMTTVDAPKEGEAVVFMGHGTAHDANSAYACMDYVLKDNGYDHVYVGTVEGYPSLDTVISKLDKEGITKVTLLPLMVVAGDHANNDMAGDEADSWKMILKSKGYDVTCIIKGLGECDAVREMYKEHCAAAIEGEAE